MAKRKEYLFLINEQDSYQHTFVYSYNHTDNIELSISRKSARVRLFQDSKRTHKDILSLDDKLCVDMLKKLQILSLLLFGKCMDINQIVVSIDGSAEEVYKKESIEDTLIWSMITNGLNQPFAKEWKKKELIEELLCVPNSRYDGRHKAFIDLSIAKSKEYQSEKMIYLWMAMNGFYNYLAAMAKDISGKQIKRETKKHDLMCNILGWDRVPKIVLPGKDADDSAEIFLKKLLTLIGSANRKQIYDKNLLYNNIISMADKLGIHLEQSQMIPLLMIWLPYKVRCNYFHANIEMPILMHRDDKLLKSLEYINRYLQEWLESELPKWLNSYELTEIHRRNIEDACNKI